LDPINIALFKKIIISLKVAGTSIIFSSHRMDHIEFFCENIIIINRGQTVVHDTISNLKESADFRRLSLSGGVDIAAIKKISGVQEIIKIGRDYEVLILNDDVADDIFKIVKETPNLRKFVLELPSLEEIFIKLVGEHNAQV